MRYFSKPIAWLLIAMLVLLAATACGPATPPPTEQEEEAAVAEEAPADATEGEAEQSEEEAAFDVELPEAEPAEPAEPVVLEGATTTDSGLQFLEVTAGDGAAPEDGDLVTMHFTGSLPDGTVFGDSYSSGEPITVVYGNGDLLPGWEEGLGMMQAGGEAKMVLPAELAFGPQGFGMIPPDSEIVLDVELLTVEDPPQPEEVTDADLIETESGLQYYDIVEGDGATPEIDSTVSTDYVMWIQEDDGARYVLSSESQGPISFVVGQLDVVFPGWDEGVQSMQEGGKRLLIVPPELGLGAEGGGPFPPNATIIMEIDLVEVNEPVRMTEVDESDYEETDSGLMYYDIVEGDGPMPEEGQIVVVHYTGWLEDGTKFDSSLDRGQPFTFPIGTGSVIAGWDEGVATMNVGGKRQLKIPADLAYGDGGTGNIPPGATLIFDVELLDVQGN